MAEHTSEIKLNLHEPRATEKTYQEQTKRVYVFPVERSMSKQSIAEIVEKEFNVTVIDVKTLIRKGKKTRYSKGKHAYPGTTYRQDKKYAYVRLATGDFIKVFEDSDNNPTDQDKAKTDSKAAKSTETKKVTRKKADQKSAGKESK